MNTLFLNFSTYSRETIVLPCQKIEVNEAVVVLKSLLLDNPKIILLEILHNQINTLLDLTKVAPYELWYFDQELIFSGKSFSLQNGEAPFQIQTHARYIVLIPREDQRVNKTNLIANFKCHSFKISVKDPFELRTFLPEYLSYFEILISERVRNNGKDPVKFKPKMVSMEEDYIRFGMLKHYGVLSLSTKFLFWKN